MFSYFFSFSDIFWRSGRSTEQQSDTSRMSAQAHWKTDEQLLEPHTSMASSEEEEEEDEVFLTVKAHQHVGLNSSQYKVLFGRKRW